MNCSVRPEFFADTSDLNEVKARLAAFENGKKAIPNKEANQPTLRKTQTADSDKGQPSNGGDDRPTLQRRDGDCLR